MTTFDENRDGRVIEMNEFIYEVVDYWCVAQTISQVSPPG
jgi:hypothetical protein